MSLRLLTLAATAPLLTGATQPNAFDMPGYRETARQWRSIEDAGAKADICRDRILKVREANDLPHLQRETASPDRPVLIAAVDQRIDGCSVMVMHRNTSDIRPLPETGNKLERIPAG